MKFEDAIKRSIKEFLKGKYPKKLAELKEEGLIYTPEWFDAFEDSLNEANGKKTSPKKKASKKPVEEAPVYEEDDEFGLGGLGYAKE